MKKYIILPILLIVFNFNKSLAAIDPSSIQESIRTNINPLTTEFEDNIENKRELDSKIEELKELGVGAAENYRPEDILRDDRRSEISSEEERLKNIGEHDLESEGRRARSNEDNKFMDRFETDYSKPGSMIHKREVDEIVAATETKLKELTKTLKEIGIDCREEDKLSEIKDPYRIETKISETKEVKYEMKLCEQPRNRYSCIERITARCSDPDLVSGKLTEVSGNMVHTIDSSGNLIIGVNRDRYFFDSWGSQQDYEFSFKVDNVDGIASFKLQSVNWADYVVIKLNDNLIFSEPGIRGGKLEISTNPIHHRRNGSEMYYGVDIGVGDYVPANTLRYYDMAPNYEARRFLRNGTNILKIRLVYANGGKIHTIFKFQEKKCNSWIENRDEICTLN